MVHDQCSLKTFSFLIENTPPQKKSVYKSTWPNKQPLAFDLLLHKINDLKREIFSPPTTSVGHKFFCPLVDHEKIGMNIVHETIKCKTPESIVNLVFPFYLYLQLQLCVSLSTLFYLFFVILSSTSFHSFFFYSYILCLWRESHSHL